MKAKFLFIIKILIYRYFQKKKNACSLGKGNIFSEEVRIIF